MRSSTTGRWHPSSPAMRRTSRRVSRCCSCVPCERFRRNRSTPARMSSRSTVSPRLTGPSVAMIFARRSMRGEYSGGSWERRPPCRHLLGIRERERSRQGCRRSQEIPRATIPFPETAPGYRRRVFIEAFMFDGLQDKLQNVFRQLKGEGRVSPEALDAALRQIRMALLEADVHFRVVKPFIERVRERALGQEVLESLTPAQQVVKIVRDELSSLLGEEGSELRLDGRPAVILLCGLQGSGKTTTAGKLAKRLKKRGRHPLLVAGDLQRAAAVEQLKQVGAAVEVPVLEPEPGEKVLDLGARALAVARQRGHDVVLMDTAGRLHVDAALMEEIRQLAGRIEPHEVLFVADSMTGQDAVKSAEQFSQVLPLTGAILTKLDGDSRGGAALSIRTVARVPIRYVGVGEKLDDLELFHPERMASRMIGMGDVLSLIEKAEKG